MDGPLWPEAARPPPPSSLTLDGGVARGHGAFPRWRERSRCTVPRNAATWRNRLRLPSRPEADSRFAAKAYSAAGQAASALHAMAILQVHQAKALKQVHEGSTDQGLMQELRTATDFALRATKVTARSLGKAMSTMVVQERHLGSTWQRSTRHTFSAPPSPREGFRRHRRGLRPAVLSGTAADRGDPPSTAPGARPQSARHRRCPPASSRAAPPQAESTRASSLRNGHLASPVRDPGSSRECLRTHRLLCHPPLLPLAAPPQVRRLCRVAACTATGGVAHAAQPVSLAHAHNSTRLRDSVHQATSQVQRRSRDVGGSPERPGLARGDCCPWQRMQSSAVPPSAEMRQGF